MAHPDPAAPSPHADPRELHIELWRDMYAQYTGTAAQLQAEGLIPPGLQWPTADQRHKWEAHGMRYQLYRCRPDDHRGPKSSWLALDHWRLRISRPGCSIFDRERKELERQAAELQRRYYYLTPQGAHAYQQAFARYVAALQDKGFQLFKQRLPGLQPRRRGGRKPSTTTQGASHA